mmetsp:Transcript_36275/g.84888  ORF Transcript_36275/g.84888 Transcript_36275/m.84888 type:complete len:222 (-) Transcript_36275:242-907(-)
MFHMTTWKFESPRTSVVTNMTVHIFHNTGSARAHKAGLETTLYLIRSAVIHNPSTLVQKGRGGFVHPAAPQGLLWSLHATSFLRSVTMFRMLPNSGDDLDLELLRAVPFLPQRITGGDDGQPSRWNATVEGRVNLTLNILHESKTFSGGKSVFRGSCHGESLRTRLYGIADVPIQDFVVEGPFSQWDGNIDRQTVGRFGKGSGARIWSHPCHHFFPQHLTS